MLKKEIAVVTGVVSQTDSAVVLSVVLEDGTEASAYAYNGLFEDICSGDRVLLNTTAVHKKLGTGGTHFVMANLSRPSDTAGECGGHMVKCRYTPVQHTVLSVEEQDSPWHTVMETAASLKGAGVVVGQLHSQLPLLCAALKELTQGSCRVVYVMPDYSCLPIGFSRLVSRLKEARLVDASITCGQAFGGDYEAINPFSAMVFARNVLNADVIAVIPGPGNAGTGTRLGFSSVEMAGILNGAAALGAETVFIPRICFADKRLRHKGLSHHTVTMLNLFTNPGTVVSVPVIDDPERSASLGEQLAESGIGDKHRITVSGCRAGMKLLRAGNICLSTMGHSFEDTPEFFYASSAAAEVVLQLSGLISENSSF